ncbi:MAG: tetratricopeptide repeat protein [Phycisphaerales bacterium]|nr:MAG: tetratricopeptide repeat protein [Phycisphaerales bacterium]
MSPPTMSLAERLRVNQERTASRTTTQASPRSGGAGRSHDGIAGTRPVPGHTRPGSTARDRGVAGPRLKKTIPDRGGDIAAGSRTHAGVRDTRLRLHGHSGARVPQARYHDRPHLVRHVPRRVHVFRDYRDRVSHRVVWPHYRIPIYYRLGWRSAFSYVHPYYHRKYVFVSLGGYWPIGCSSLRYYWYGYHPYVWCGYYPMPHEVIGASHNYYTYNYYGSDYTSGQAAYTQTSTDSYIEPVDHTTFADVREKLAQQAAEPDAQTLVDTRFEEAVKTFESGDYSTAIEKFAEATELAPDDVILPFAYTQALFANEQYAEAAEVLRAALAKVAPEKESVFYPRGLYSKDEVLFEQINCLIEKAELDETDADLQLLLGYQLLGIGELDAASEHLERAIEDPKNAPGAEVLLRLLHQIKAESAGAEDAEEEAKQ